MLVYANHLSFQGPGAEQLAFRAVGAWLKEQLGRGLHPKQLLSEGEYDGMRDGVRSWLRINATSEEKPELYCWVLKLPDAAVRGRQWIVEVGLKNSERGVLDLSCVLRSDEHSTIVASPVVASRPRVIRYVAENVLKDNKVDFTAEVPGIRLKSVGPDQDSYRALLVEIERPDREGPIVLVSADRQGEYQLDVEYLQHTLIGLAQVVKISPDFNSYEMADVLGQRRSAWGGAVNMLYMPTPVGFIRNRLFLSDAIAEWGDQHARISHILAWVTSNTNIPRLRKHIRPEGVVQLSVRRRVHAAVANSYRMDEAELRQTLEQTSAQVANQERIFDDFAEQNSQLEATIEHLRDDLKSAQDDVDGKEYTIKILQHQLERAGVGRPSPYGDHLIKVLYRTEPLSPSDCLDIIEHTYGDRCIVLESARESAKDTPLFTRGADLLHLLQRLVTDYREKLATGGDSEARRVFGKNEYAAKESETVMKNPKMRRERKFEYDGKEIEMFRHLKVGVRDDETKTIRVHFHWDADVKKIVIGYCGQHRSISSR